MSLLRIVLAVPAALLGLLLVLPVALVVMPLWGVAAITRGVRRGLLRREPDALPWKRLLESAPEVGWKPRANLDTWGRADGVFRLTTDADGWRGRTRLDAADLVVVGDSFAFGFGIDDADFFAEHVPGLQVKSIGANGYSMVHGLLWMRRLAPALCGKPVVWMVYHGNDPYENLKPNLDHYRMPFVRETAGGGWEIVSQHVSPRPWTATSKRDYYARLAELCCPTFLAGRAWSAAHWLVGEARQALAVVDARLIVVGVPDVTQLDPVRMQRLIRHAPDAATFDPGAPDRELGRICAELDVPFVALGPRLRPRHYQAADVHWNAAGHRRVAAVLAELHAHHVGRPSVRQEAG